MGVNGIYGLSGSGLDIESMVKASMLTKQSQYDKMYKKETKQEWTKAAYNDFYNSMMTYRFSTLSTYKLESNMNAMGATSSDSKVVTVSANAEAAAMSHKVNVTDMVVNPYLQTKDTIKRNASDQTSIYLKDILGQSLTYTADATDSAKDTVSVDGVTHKASDVALSLVVSGGDDTTYTTTYPASTAWTDNGDGTSYATATTTDGTTTYTTKYTLNNSTGRISAADTTDESGNTYATSFTSNTSEAKDLDVSKGTTNITIKGKSFNLSAAGTKVPTSGQTLVYTYKQLNEKTLYDLASDIKGLGTDIDASYDSVNDSFSIFNKNGGSASKINISAFTGTYTDSDGDEVTGATADSAATANFYSLFNNLGLAAYNGTELGDAIVLKDTNSKINEAGKDGSITVDGKVYKNLTSNKVTVAGVTYNLLAAGTSTVTVSQDTDAIVKNVKQFVDDYNKLLDSLNTKINEKATSGYEPLTKAEKSAMKDDEITAWETKAKSGLLYHDSILRDITSKMREAVSTPVSSVTSSYDSAAALGITSSTDQGHLTLDETKLRKALTADPSCVYKVFASSTDDDDDTNNTGIANRLDSVMKTAISKVASQAGTTSDSDDQSYLGLQITSMQTKMKAFATAMDDYRDALYKKFDAMETALASLNSQYSFVTSSFS